MIRDKIFYLACFGFVLGVLWRSFFRADWHTILFIGILYAFLILFSFVIFKKNWDVFISIFLLAFLFGILRFQMADTPAPEVFETRVGEEISLFGLIADEPVPSENSAKFTFKTTMEEAKTSIVIFAKPDLLYSYGDEIEVSGVLEKSKNFMTDQGLEFDYVNYLRKDDIFYLMHNPKIEILSSGHGSAVKRALFYAKENFVAAIAKAIPEPESALMKGLILGERASFSESLTQAFIATGLIHIVTISGYNVSLVAKWIMEIFGFLPMSFAVILGIFTIFLFVIMTGAAQTAIRAGIMASLALMARITGRTYDAGRALLLAGVVMIFINPFILAYDVSFQLSYLATVAVIHLSPIAEKYFLRIKWRHLRDIVASTIAVYIFVLPFILYKIGNLSLVALPANFAVLPIIPITMILGFITGFAGLISPVLSYIPGKIAYTLLYYQIAVIGIFARLPFALVAIPYFPLALVILIYAIFIYNFFTGHGQKEAKETEETLHKKPLNIRFTLLLIPFLLTVGGAGYFYYRHYELNQATHVELQKLLATTTATEPTKPLHKFISLKRTKSSGCEAEGPLPDHACSPGAVFNGATVQQICVKGYTKTVRNVSTKLRKEVYGEYGVSYPQPRGAYEVDHLVPLALGGSNEISNLFLEAALPAPGFHEKDIVEVFLQQEVCSGRVALPAAQQQIAADWLAVYNNMTFEEKLAIKKKYGISINQ